MGPLTKYLVLTSTLEIALLSYKKLQKWKKRKERKNSFENLIQKFALFAEKFLSGNGSLLFIFVDKNATRASSSKVTGRVLLRTRHSNFLI